MKVRHLVRYWSTLISMRLFLEPWKRTSNISIYVIRKDLEIPDEIEIKVSSIKIRDL